MADEKKGHSSNDPTQEFLTVLNSLASPMGDLLSTFMMDMSAAEFKNRMHYATFMQTIAAMKNVEWGISVGIIGLEQALTLMANLPLANYVNKDYFGPVKATQDMCFRVATSKKSQSEFDENVKSHAGGKIGGFLGIFGGGSFSVDSDTTYKTGERRGTDCSATVDTHVEYGRLPAPETVSFLESESDEVVKEGMKLSKIMLEKQKNKLTDDVDSAEVPKDLPKDDDEFGDLFGDDDADSTFSDNSELDTEEDDEG